MCPVLEIPDRDLVRQIENCTLNPVDFTHEIQLKLCYILIKKYGLESAIGKNQALKENFYVNAMRSNKYNATLTRAYTEILNHFMELSPNASFDKLMREYPRLKHSFKDLVKTHYGYDILKEHRKEDPNNLRPILFTF